MEESNKISFLDVLVTNENGSIQTSVYRKATNTDVYMNWNSYAPKTWKVATLKSLVKRAFMVSLTEVTLDKELVHLKKSRDGTPPMNRMIKTATRIKKKKNQRRRQLR